MNNNNTALIPFHALPPPSQGEGLERVRAPEPNDQLRVSVPSQVLTDFLASSSLNHTDVTDLVSV
jgi:hypothetical protein